MAYDAADAELVVFGGVGPSGYPLGDTWTYSRGAWTNVTSFSPSHPPARSGAALAWDPSGQLLVLFGGVGFTGSLYNDTWTFHAGVWTNRTSSLSIAPPALLAPSLVTDSSDGLVLLTGGAGAEGPFGGTWTWKAGGWTNISSTAGAAPSPRLWSEASNDPADHGVLLFGGYDENVSYFSDTWLFHAGSWTNLTATLSSSPPPTIEGALLWEAPTQSLVLCQGSHVTGLGIPLLSPYVWVWEHGAWTNLTAPLNGAPAMRDLSSVAALPNGGGLGVLFGGWGASSELGDLELLHPGLLLNASLAPLLVPVGSAVQAFSNATGGVPPVKYGWSWGDGSRSGSENASHAYAAAGTYPVQLLANDSLGERSYANFSVRVVSGLAVSAGATPSSTDVGFAVDLRSTVLGGTPPYSYSWDLGDGSPVSTSASPSHAYSSPGTYQVTLTVTDAKGLQGASSLNVSVHALPQVSFAATPATPRVNVTVQFTTLLTGGEAPFSYAWTFGDGGLASIASPTHAYRSAGIFQVRENVSDAAGATASANLSLQVASTGLPLTLTASVSPRSGTPLTTFSFSSIASGGSPPYTITWSFGDGGHGTGANVTHSYARASASPYPVFANVSDASGALASLSLQVYVNSSGSPGGGSGGGGGGGGSGGGGTLEVLSSSKWSLLLLLVAVGAVAILALLVVERRHRSARVLRPSGPEGQGIVQESPGSPAPPSVPGASGTAPSGSPSMAAGAPPSESRGGSSPRD